METKETNKTFIIDVENIIKQETGQNIKYDNLFQNISYIDNNIALILKKINKYFLINYKLNFEYEGKVINIIPIETEIYFSKINKDNIPNDGMCHMNDLQKGKDKNGNYRFGKLYFHRWKSSNNIQCASNKTNKGGADVCISNSNDYYLSILIRSAFINGTTEKYLVSGTRRICNRIKEICFDETQGCLQSFFKDLEKFSTIVKIERNEGINIDNIFAQPRIVGNKYHEGTKIYKLNCLNLGKNYQYLEWIKKQKFYTEKRKKKIIKEYKDSLQTKN